MTYSYLERTTDAEQIKMRTESFSSHSDEALRHIVQEARETGGPHSHDQALDLIALHPILIRRFGKSPVQMEGRKFIRLDPEPLPDPAKEEKLRQFRSKHQQMLSALARKGYDQLNDEERAYWNSVY
ncbi:MAG TPA: hypothetical protein PKM27_02745 [Saprospiraceae bacterium]|nr:hypothetical protein [Saprospiraceae bacterium]HNT19022.1 hypothetical protein [Saprospiraceae bacterium]